MLVLTLISPANINMALTPPLHLYANVIGARPLKSLGRAEKNQTEFWVNKKFDRETFVQNLKENYLACQETNLASKSRPKKSEFF